VHDAGVGVNVATEVRPALANVDHVYVALEPHRGYGLDGALRTWEEVARPEPDEVYANTVACQLVRGLKRAYLAGMPCQEGVPFSSCRHEEYNLHVRADGELTPCQHWKAFTLADLDEFGDLRELEPEGPCRDCPRFEECQGGCNAYAWNVAGRLMPDPRCPRVRGSP
jgi:radical SAM protein with 4Fe4S-binding SPASM domain